MVHRYISLARSGDRLVNCLLNSNCSNIEVQYVVIFWCFC